MAALALTLVMLLTALASAVPTLMTKEVSLAAGEKLELTCSLENDNNNVVIWKKSNRVLYAGNIRVRHDSRLEVVEDSLVIRSLAPEDEGDYTCSPAGGSNDTVTVTVTGRGGASRQMFTSYVAVICGVITMAAVQ